jgi:hypothetical protein
MQAIESILQNFGNSEIVVCLDGYSSDVFTSFCCERQIHLTLGPRLKTADNAGRWIERLLSAAVASTTADVVVKLDPDTVFLRPFEVDNPDRHRRQSAHGWHIAHTFRVAVRFCIGKQSA